MWSILKKIRGKKSEPPAVPDSRTSVHCWLEAGAAASLEEAVAALSALMEDPDLGGPGFLTVQLPQRAGDPASVSCQYPNISETLYRAARRGAAEDLLAAGVPPALLDRGLRWETESGAVVILTLDAAPVGEEVVGLLAQLHSRNQVLGALAEALSRRCPGFTVRPLAGSLLLTPTPAAPSDPPDPGPDGGPD